MRGNRGRALLILLLALLAVAAAPAARQGFDGENPSVAIAPDNPVTHQDLRDWLPRAARHVFTTPLPDSWVAVYAHTPGTPALPGRSVAGGDAGTGVAVGVATAPSTRAPPARVS